MKTLGRLLCGLLPAPPTTELAEYIKQFNAPRIYMPSAEARVRNRTLPQGICRKAGRRTPAHSKAANGGSCCH
jgi:hypothetical protein